jgi:transposase
MRYVGLDVHKRIIQAHFCDQHGHRLETMRFDLNAASLQKFALHHLGSDCAVALEATTNTWAVVDILTPHCAQITVSNPLRTKAIALSKHKSDRVDAEALAQLLRCGYLPKVWIADPHTRQERNLAARRSALVRQGALIKNRVHSILHQHLIQAPFDPFTQQGRQWLSQLQLAPHLRVEITTQLRMLDAVASEQKELMALIERSAYASDAVKLLMTLPGVGVATAQALVAAIGDISRFQSADKLAAYFGLVPSVHQSAEHAYHGSITKQGNSNVRWLLVELLTMPVATPDRLGTSSPG